MISTLYSKIKLDISNEILDKLNIKTRDIKFECNSIEGKTGDFVIDDDKKLCHTHIEYEKIEGDDVLKSGVFWNGTEYSRVASSELIGMNFIGVVKATAFVVGSESDAEISAEFNFNLGVLLNQDIKVNLMDNSKRKKETERIRKIVIDRETKKNKLSYKILSTLFRKPLVEFIIFIRTGVSIFQDILWGLERKLNKI